MPKRDGSPTAEEQAQAQQRGLGVAPVAVAAAGDPEQERLAALALTNAAVTTAAPVAVSFAAAGILNAFDRFLQDRRGDVEQSVMGLLEAEAPGLSVERRATITDTELEAERAYQAKAKARLNRDLPKALMVSDPDVRRAMVEAVLDREKRIARMREEAVAMRALGEAELDGVLSESPEGAFWKLSDHVSEHTPDCLAMGGKAWPRSVLRRFHPPTHYGCECELVAIPRALSEGLMTVADIQDADQAVHALSLQETPWDPDELDADVRLLEAAYDLRWHAGTEHGGEFRPRRGGDPGALVHKLLRRRRMDLADVGPGHAPAANVPGGLDRNSALIRARDAAMRTGDTHFVVPTPHGHAIAKARPIDDREHFEVHPTGDVHHVGAVESESKSHSELAREATDEARRLMKESHADGGLHRVTAEEWGPIVDAVKRHIHHADLARADGEEGAPHGYVYGPITLGKFEEHAKRAQRREKNYEGVPRSGIVKIKGLDESHYGRIVKRNQASVDVHEEDGAIRRYQLPVNRDAEHHFSETVGKPVGRGEPWKHRPISEPEPEPAPRDPRPPAHHTGGVTHEHVERLVGAKQPKAAGELIPGVHFDPSISRSETRDGALHLPPGFFKLTRGKREGVIHRHHGRRLADALGPEGRKRLAEQAPHLSSPTRIAETYHGINAPGRAETAALHPDAARLVAEAAREHGLPLHPDAAKLVGTPAARDRVGEEHSASVLAKRVHGMPDSEVESTLREGGYFFAATNAGEQGGDRPHPIIVYRNHEHGGAITVHYTPSQPDRPNTVESTEVQVHPAQFDGSALRGDVVGRRMGDVVGTMRDRGFEEVSPNGDGWQQFVNPDGRGIALRADGPSPAWDEKLVVDGRNFTPTDREIDKARIGLLGARIRAGDISAIEPGMDAREVYRAFNNAHGSQRYRHGTSDGDTGIEGADSFSDYTLPGTTPEGDVGSLVGPETIRVAEKDGKVVAVGRPPQPAKSAMTGMVDEGTYAERRRLQIAAVKAAHEQASAGARATEKKIADALGSGDERRIFEALKGHDVGDAVRLLRGRHNFTVRSRRRTGHGDARSITYTLRGTDGTTLKITGKHTFRDSGVTKVRYEGNPQGGDRTRLPRGQTPKTPAELYRDALGRADELGARYGAGVNVTSIHVGGVQRGSLAHHEWGGAVVIQKRSEQEAKAYLQKRQAGEPLTDRDHLAFYNFVEVLAHEVNHGIGKPGDEQGGLAFGPDHYSGLGKTLEEALTEETGHDEAVQWLREMDMTDVLEAVKRNPRDSRVLGTYTAYRRQLKDLFDRAGVPEENRRELIHDMKQRQGPRERVETLARLLGVEPSRVRALIQQGERERLLRSREPSALRDHAEFEPISRPDLGDIHVAPPHSTLGGRAVHVGDTVTLHLLTDDPVDFEKREPVEGEVVAIDGETVSGNRVMKVRKPDGTAVWYDPDHSPALRGGS